MLHITLDLQGLKDIEEGLLPAAQSALKQATEDLAIATHAHIIELAQQGLHSRRQMYLDGLHLERVSDTLFMVVLDSKVSWIDDGLPARSLLDSLLKSPKAKMGKNGRYIAVPFKYNVKPSERTPTQNDLIEAIQGELKKRKLPSMNKIEKFPNGNPKIGLVRTLNVNTPLKTREGVGMGHGPIGAPRQGHTGIPFLQGVRFYQHKNDKGKVVKTAVTFRMASDSQRGSGKWDAPELEGTFFFEKAKDWALGELEGQIYPSIMNALKAAL